jgi:hypothetical protein
MSWGILTLNSRVPVDFERGDWADFDSKQGVAASISATFPESQWLDASWGTLDHREADIEFNLASAAQIGNNFMLHVRGGQDPVGAISRMCQQHGWLAYDMAADAFIGIDELSNHSFVQWKSYKDAIVSGEAPQDH